MVLKPTLTTTRKLIRNKRNTWNANIKKNSQSQSKDTES